MGNSNGRDRAPCADDVKFESRSLATKLLAQTEIRQYQLLVETHHN